MKEIRIGIIGCGIIAHLHMEYYAEIPNAKVIAVCDINKDKLTAFADQYSIQNRYQDYRQLLMRDDIDSVDVCLHNNLHAPISIDVMAAGKNCYCEKPMAGSYTDALAMKKAAEVYGVKLHIQLSLLYGAQMLCAKQLIDNGLLGNIYHARSYGYRRMGRPFVDGYAEKEFDNSYWAGHGALFDMGVYHISQLLYLMNLPTIERISGNIYQELPMNSERKAISQFDVEELGTGYVKFSNHLSMSIIESWAIHGHEFPMSSIYGNTGGLQITNGDNENEQTIEYYSFINGYPAKSILDISSVDVADRRFLPKRSYLANSQAHWIAVLSGECAQIQTPEIALQTMLISEGIFLSDKLGREVTADEIVDFSHSIAIQKQDTPFGELRYKLYPFI